MSNDPLCTYSFPIFSFALPLYSFWNMDDANWGNTRVVVGEGKEKKIIADAEDHYDDSMIPLKRFSGESGPHAHALPVLISRLSAVRI